MNEQLHEMMCYLFQTELNLSLGKATTLAGRLEELSEFFDLDDSDFADLKSIKGRKVSFSKEEVNSILRLKDSGLVLENKSVQENYIIAMGREFTRRQIDMVKSLKLGELNVNPFVVNSLNLDTPRKLVHLYAYMLATRSIVTSMGYFLQSLLISSSPSVSKIRAGWDAVKVDANGVKNYIQLKSGTNDMDKDQIDHWLKEIEAAIARGHKAYIGMAYGKKTDNTVSMTLIRQLVPDWEMKTLIGRELWDFVSGDSTYHTKLLNSLRSSSTQVLHSASIVDELETSIDRMVQEFENTYGKDKVGIDAFIAAIF